MHSKCKIYSFQFLPFIYFNTFNCIFQASAAIEKDNVQSQKRSSSTQIKYACLKNIAALYVLKGSTEEAVEAYLEVFKVFIIKVSNFFGLNPNICCTSHSGS